MINLAYQFIHQFSSADSINCLSILSNLFQSRPLSGLLFTKSAISQPIRALGFLIDFNNNVHQAYDNGFLVSSRETFAIFLKFIQPNPLGIIFLTSAKNDIGALFTYASEYYTKLESFFANLITMHFISQTLSQIETEL
jgi:hypothetical protein